MEGVGHAVFWITSGFGWHPDLPGIRLEAANPRDLHIVKRPWTKDYQ